jgi:hypothetical protein
MGILRECVSWYDYLQGDLRNQGRVGSKSLWSGHQIQSLIALDLVPSSVLGLFQAYLFPTIYVKTYRRRS